METLFIRMKYILPPLWDCLLLRTCIPSYPLPNALPVHFSQKKIHFAHIHRLDTESTVVHGNRQLTENARSAVLAKRVKKLPVYIS